MFVASRSLVHVATLLIASRSLDHVATFLIASRSLDHAATLLVAYQSLDHIAMFIVASWSPDHVATFSYHLNLSSLVHKCSCIVKSLSQLGSRCRQSHYLHETDTTAIITELMSY